MADKVRPNTVSQSKNEMSHTIWGHWEPKMPITQTQDIETGSKTSNTWLKGQTHRIHREGKRSRGEGNFKEEFLGAGVGDEVDRRSKPCTHLCLNLEARGEIPVEEAIHWGRREEIVGLNPRIAMGVAWGGGRWGSRRHPFEKSLKLLGSAPCYVCVSMLVRILLIQGHPLVVLIVWSLLFLPSGWTRMPKNLL